MRIRDIWVRTLGGTMAICGITLVLISGELYEPAGVEWFSGRGAEFILRAGFGLFLIGLLVLFLYSWRSVPEYILSPFLDIEMMNIGREVQSLKLKGNGIYIPGVRSRLSEDRVFIPLEKKELPIPEPSDDQVFNTGSAGPSMGISILPPGKGLVDDFEKRTGRNYLEERMIDAQEALDAFGKGSGLYRSIRIRTKGNRIDLTINNSMMRSVCEFTSKKYPTIHRQVGCPGCSAVICIVARISGSPVRILEVNGEGGIMNYILVREV
jgi:hypothetical protein